MSAALCAAPAHEASSPLRVIEFKAFERGDFRGWATVELAFGIIVPSCRIHADHRKAWALAPILRPVSWPGSPPPMMRFATIAHEAVFCRAVAAAVVAAHPEIIHRST